MILPHVLCHIPMFEWCWVLGSFGRFSSLLIPAADAYGCKPDIETEYMQGTIADRFLAAK